MKPESQSKQALRQSLLAQRKRFSPESCTQVSAVLCARVRASELYLRHQILLAYVPVRGEIALLPLLQTALRDGKQLFFPRCDPTLPGHMQFFRVQDLSELQPGAHGIPEPDGTSLSYTDGTPTPLPDGGLCLVPGLSFTTQGARLGYGGGYYDRFLVDFSGETLALCDLRLRQDHLPVEAHDCLIQNVFFA